MQFNKKFLISSLIVLVAVTFVWGAGSRNGWFSTKAEGEAASPGSADQANASQSSSATDNLNQTFSGNETPIEVQGEKAFRGDLIQRVSAQGRVHAYQNIDIQNEVSGRVLDILVQDGDTVKQGQVIALIDDRDYLLAHEDAKSRLLKAQAEYVVESRSAEEYSKPSDSTENPQSALDELAKMLEQGLLSQKDYDAKKQQIQLDQIRSGSLRNEVIAARTLDTAAVEVKRTQLNLEKCTVRSPFDGMIFEISIARGQVLPPSQKIARLVNLKDLVVKAHVLESEMGQVFRDRPAKITFPALPDLSKTMGHVQAISPLVNPTDKTVETIVRFRSDDERIRPGMFAEVLIDAKIYKDRLLVPKTAILPRDNRFVVFKVGPDNRAKWVYVDKGVENESYIEIVDGQIEPGDMVLTDNHFTMGHDTLVEIVDKDEKQGS